jgi:hypothetical protein
VLLRVCEQRRLAESRGSCSLLQRLPGSRFPPSSTASRSASPQRARPSPRPRTILQRDRLPPGAGSPCLPDLPPDRDQSYARFLPAASPAQYAAEGQEHLGELTGADRDQLEIASQQCPIRLFGNCLSQLQVASRPGRPTGQQVAVPINESLKIWRYVSILLIFLRALVTLCCFSWPQSVTAIDCI